MFSLHASMGSPTFILFWMVTAIALAWLVKSVTPEDDTWTITHETEEDR